MSNMWLMSGEVKGEKFRLATNQKVPGSIPEGLFWNFYWHNLSGKTMLLWLKLQCMCRPAMGLIYFYIVWKQIDWGQPGLPQQGWTVTGRLSFRGAPEWRLGLLPVDPERKVTHFKTAWYMKVCIFSQRCMWISFPSIYDTTSPDILCLKYWTRLVVWKRQEQLHSDTVSYRRMLGFSCICLRSAKFGVNF